MNTTKLEAFLSDWEELDAIDPRKNEEMTATDFRKKEEQIAHKYGMGAVSVCLFGRILKRLTTKDGQDDLSTKEQSPCS